MTTYPESELIEFIKSQPDEREINMSQPCWEEGLTNCGCVLVHFGQAKGLKLIKAGFHYLNHKHMVEETDVIQKLHSHDVTTYAQAKALLL
jgi:hypothetical protein